MPADINAILKIQVPVRVEIGARSMSVTEVMALAPGAIIELPKGADEELELLAGAKRIGCGRAVKVGENFGLRVTHIGDVEDRIQALGRAEAASDAALDPAIHELLAGDPPTT